MERKVKAVLFSTQSDPDRGGIPFYELLQPLDKRLQVALEQVFDGHVPYLTHLRTPDGMQGCIVICSEKVPDDRLTQAWEEARDAEMIDSGEVLEFTL